jgi:hypothetical protein
MVENKQKWRNMLQPELIVTVYYEKWHHQKVGEKFLLLFSDALMSFGSKKGDKIYLTTFP